MDDISPIIVEAAGVFGACEIKLRVGSEAIAAATVVVDEARAADLGTFQGQFLVPGGKATAERFLDVTWQDGRSEIDRDTEIAVDILCEYIANALDALHDSRPLRASSTGSVPQA
jgi:hypothetical protein